MEYFSICDSHPVFGRIVMTDREFLKLKIGTTLMNISNRFIAQAAIIAALYAALTIVLAPFSFGVFQVRVSEMLTVLPFLTSAAIPGLFLGCAIANLFSPAGIIDVVFGSLFTLIAAILTYLLGKTKKPILAPLPPVVINAFGVSLYLHLFFKVPYLTSVIGIGLGQITACYILGLPLLLVLSVKKPNHKVKL